MHRFEPRRGRAASYGHGMGSRSCCSHAICGCTIILRSTAARSGGEVVPLFVLDPRCSRSAARTAPVPDGVPRRPRSVARHVAVVGSDRARGRVIVAPGCSRREVEGSTRCTYVRRQRVPRNGASRRSATALARLGVELARPSRERGGRAGRRRAAGQDAYSVFTPYHRAWAQAPRRGVLRSAGRRSRRPPSIDPGPRPDADAVRRGLDRPAPGRRGRGPQAPRGLPRTVPPLATPTVRERSRRRRDLAALAVPAVRQRERERGRRVGASRFPARRSSSDRSRGVTSTGSCSPTTRRSRGATSVTRPTTAAVPAARRAYLLERWQRGRDRHPARRRGHAAAAPGRVDAQPRPHGDRVVPDPALGHPVAARAPSTSCAGSSTATRRTTPGAGSGWRHRHRSATLALVQPGPAGRAVRPRRRLRAAVRAGARRRAGAAGSSRRGGTPSCCRATGYPDADPRGAVDRARPALPA